MKINYQVLEKKLNIKFKNRDLLSQSLTHKSFDSNTNNEKLEFLGDRVLGLVIAKKLLEIYPNEKEAKLAAELEKVFPRHFLGIEGHLDTQSLEGTSWQSAHQLTTAQSSAVFDFLATRTPLSDRQMFLVAHGANHPVVSNATAAGKQRNRRVECVIYPEQAAAQNYQ